MNWQPIKTWAQGICREPILGFCPEQSHSEHFDFRFQMLCWVKNMDGVFHWTDEVGMIQHPTHWAVPKPPSGC
jgi:hypothetical protein